MDDGRPYMWTHFLMEDDMSTIVILPLVEGFSSFIVVAPSLVQLSIVKQCQKRKKMVMMKQIFEGNGVMLFSLTSLICMKKSGNVLTNLVYHSSIRHTFALNTIVNCWMNVVTKKNNFFFYIEKKKSEY
jgi:hypothetical protein